MATITMFESVSCGRCGGSGRYSYCEMYGTTCFNCGGSGRRLTKRGALAQSYYRSLLSKPAGDFEPGDLFQPNGPGGAGRFTRVVEVVFDSEPSVWVNGVGVYHVTLRTENGGWSMSPETVLRFGATGQQKAEAKEKALAFQATLTKAGKVRKNAQAAG